jgi:SAM-dependent methyltransferase
MDAKLQSLIDSHLLKCKHCNSHLVYKELIFCSNCGKTQLIQNDKLYNIDATVNNSILDPLDQVKSKLKKYKVFYHLLKVVVSPIYFDKSLDRFIENAEGLVLNVGSGNTSLANNIINVDFIDYDNVTLVSNISDMPLMDNSVDRVIVNSVLEHVEDPEKVISEIKRVLKPNGLVYSSTPFLVGFHASPYDYHRWTLEGVKQLFSDFDIVSLSQEGGPTSALLWVFQEWLAIVFSFGSQKLHDILLILFMLLTWPIKYLDIIFSNSTLSNNISSCFVCIARKPDTSFHV